MGITPVAVLDVCVPSSVFLYNNIKKVENGENARGTVVFAQGAKIAQAIAKYHDSTAKGASEAYNIFGKYAAKSKILDYTGKGINWATRNVNPLICASAAYKTVTSDDKVRTGITQLGAISGMFVGEGLMKLHSDKLINEENIRQLAEKVKNVNGLKTIASAILEGNYGGKIASILKGIAFVTASMTSYNIGQKLAEGTANRVCTNLGHNSTTKAENPQFNNEPGREVSNQKTTEQAEEDNSEVSDITNNSDELAENYENEEPIAQGNLEYMVSNNKIDRMV